MYRDDDIKLPLERFPAGLVKDIEALDQAYDKGEENWFEFYMQRDEVEVNAKSYCINHKITDKELELIYKKYGLRA